ncbi:MAG: hypothetical protein A3H50_01875 [Candidatus Levybacteria bacterium RIFCSPLOWO2_02_FULL_37_10]|nr:MAG: hypothetical protein A2860_04890 [Candidatus Levybacteria bacterium RIFCSPHIGHO2_01_FULL_37_33]OGH29673.1 MAG: hypothetical protein A3F30_00765 [Candidatus Levybacteria bacterium RIFCSPHIGHO2_12_FULL_37_12]OGH32617.1 MAG: hypothetical protein A2953_00620 [Candidatus Levybacteria bacterium RIFCSPLOWO2_01_FULL_36_54]OGH43568.1 MAG: hypothetical protein A3H50_01875 [Candidatus Levybacteria bacterium RIFCSPLOWO2_02_FULL_37_10]
MKVAFFEIEEWEKRITNGYRKISIYSFEIQIPKVPPYEEVLIHLAPNETKNTVEARIWYQNQLVYKSFYPLSCFKQSSLES